MNTNINSAVVDFVGIGAPRAATTYLDSLLRSHPDLHLPEDRKEVHYFDQHFHRGADWYRNTISKHAEQNQKVGEITPAYFYASDIPMQLAALAPEVRIIVCLRDPVQRSFSHYLRVCNLKQESKEFLDFMGSDSPIFTASEYGRNIGRWLEHFSSDQLLVINSATIGTDKNLAALADHLSVKEDGFSIPKNRLNSNTGKKSIFYRSAKSIGRFAYRHNLDGVLKFRESVAVLLDTTQSKKINNTELDAETYSRAATYFREDAKLLDNLIGFDATNAWPELFK